MQRKKPVKVQYLDRELVRGNVYYALCVTEAQFLAELKRLNVPRQQHGYWVNPRAYATTHYLEDGDDQICLVCIAPPQTDTPSIEVVGLLVHEAVHVWQAMRDSMGETNPSAEFEAYGIQMLSARLIQSYVDQVFGKSK